MPRLFPALRYYQALFGVCNNKLAETEEKKETERFRGLFQFEDGILKKNFLVFNDLWWSGLYLQVF